MSLGKAMIHARKQKSIARAAALAGDHVVGQYTVQTSNAAVVTVTTPVTSTADVMAIAINAVGSGTANVTVSDSNGQSVVFTVTVTLTPITIQGTRGAGRQR